MVSRKTLAYGLTANVVVLGFVSLFTDVSSEMILPILPFFLTQVLFANASIVGRASRPRSPLGRHPRLAVSPGVPLARGAAANADPESTAARRLPRDPEAALGLPGNREPLLLRRLFLCLPPASSRNSVRDDAGNLALCPVQRGLRGPRVPGGHPLGSGGSEAGRPDRLRRVHRDVDVARPLGRPPRLGRGLHPVRPELRDGGGDAARPRRGLRAPGYQNDP